jgi:HEPN domain-containing protein
MSGLDDAPQWVERAEEDYRLSISALRRKQPLLYGATFHAQQCGEKYLKALLVLRQVAFPRTHDLTALGTLCDQNGIILPIDPDDLDRLTTYAVEVRYPGLLPAVEDAQEAVRIAKSIRKFARQLLV